MIGMSQRKSGELFKALRVIKVVGGISFCVTRREGDSLVDPSTNREEAAACRYQLK